MAAARAKSPVTWRWVTFGHTRIEEYPLEVFHSEGQPWEVRQDGNPVAYTDDFAQAKALVEALALDLKKGESGG